MAKRKRNYHMLLAPVVVTGRDRIWRCDYCGEMVDIDNPTDCSYVYPPCEFCGGCDESNECRPDCPGILAALSGKDVYVAGELPKATKAALRRRGRT